ncbi:MAG: DUF3859 domain-containing protein [Bacteroidia bacterium]|nr:DUF3859 domain-containing protein [Bacteroidia bacterium]
MRIKLLILTIFTVQSYVFGQPFLQTPIGGEQGKDWIVVNYVDWDTAGVKDHHCGTKAYDGHQGTDYVLKSFRQMDNGVDVLAAENGVVTYVQDGLFDRETEGIISKKLGNYVALRHDNKYYTYYAHLKKNSIPVKVGDTVKSGEVVGQVGSSGNSTDPHLHFEVWYDSAVLVDPYQGPCGNSTSLFTSPVPYDTGLYVWESGIHRKNELNINELRERIVTEERPYQFKPSSDSVLNFWAHLSGVRKGKVVQTDWYAPDGQLWFSFDVTLDQDYWYYYFWTFINHQNLAIGEWKVVLLYDGKQVVEEAFEVDDNVGLDQLHFSEPCASLARDLVANKLNTLDLKRVEVFDVYGREVEPQHDLVPGIYIFQIAVHEGNVCRFKKWME